MDIKLQLKPLITQRLIMMPRLQQAIKMLQLSRMEFLGKIQQELEENPAQSLIFGALQLNTTIDHFHLPIDAWSIGNALQ